MKIFNVPSQIYGFRRDVTDAGNHPHHDGAYTHTNKVGTERTVNLCASIYMKKSLPYGGVYGKIVR